MTIGPFWSPGAGLLLQTVATVPLDANGNPTGNNVPVAPTITVQNASYAVGNDMGGLITVANLGSAGGSGFITALAVRSKGASANQIYAYGFSKLPTSTITDKAAFVLNAADLPYLIGGAPFLLILGNAPGAWDTATYAQLQNQTVQFTNQDTTPSKNTYWALVTANTVTPASTSDLNLYIDTL